jgi:hypothetical protein
MSYHNTTETLGAELREYQDKATTQEARILAFYTACMGRAYPPSQVWRMVFFEAVPLTSIRRAISELTNDGMLEKTTTQKDGPYGRPEFCWRLRDPQLRLLP